MKPLHVLIENEHYEKLKDLAHKKRISMAEIIRIMIENYTEKEN